MGLRRGRPCPVAGMFRQDAGAGFKTLEEHGRIKARKARKGGGQYRDAKGRRWGRSTRWIVAWPAQPLCHCELDDDPDRVRFCTLGRDSQSDIASDSGADSQSDKAKSQSDKVKSQSDMVSPKRSLENVSLENVSRPPRLPLRNQAARATVSSRRMRPEKTDSEESTGADPKACCLGRPGPWDPPYVPRHPPSLGVPGVRAGRLPLRECVSQV